MSLLLDALKKAAEKKARKDAEQTAVDETEIDPTATLNQTATEVTAADTGQESAESESVPDAVDSAPAPQADETELTSTHIEATELDATEVDATTTRVDATELDQTATQVEDSTELDATQAEVIAAQTDAARLDATEADLTATQVDSTELDALQGDADSTRFDATQVEPDADDAIVSGLDAADVSATRGDPARLDETEVDATHRDPDQSATQTMEIDSGSTRVEEPFSDATDTEVESTAWTDDPGEEQDAAGEDAETMEISYRNGMASSVEEYDEDSVQSNYSVDDTASVQKDDTSIHFSVDDDSSLTDEDRTLYIEDEDDDEQLILQTPAVSNPAQMTETQVTEPKARDTSGDDEDETLVLTPDDVTEFMGDGFAPPRQTAPQQPSVVYETSDDTTATASGLSLTDIQGYDTDDTATGPSAYEQPLELELEDVDTASQPDVLDVEDDKSTMLNDGTTTPAPGVDLETLTNDQAVSVGGKTKSRANFAPDNYDRTLMKLSDNDASRIFPGMKGESDTVMTPDYAKRVFQSKSRNVKSYYYKLYSGVAAIVLLAVAFWGMTQVQQEMTDVDNGLVRLKRDPMPGLLLPGREEETDNLFERAADTDARAQEVLATAQTRAEQTSPAAASEAGDQPSDSSAASPREPVRAEGDIEAQAVQTGAEMGGESRASTDDQAPTRTDQSAAAARASAKPGASAGQTARASGSLQIESSSRIVERDRVLNQAYSAYQDGDTNAAKEMYRSILAVNTDDRDALLGRAAIHVLDNEYQNAIEIYQQLLLANPKDSQALVSLVSVANVDPEAGETEIKRLLREQPDAPFLHFALGNMYGTQNRWLEAQTAYFEALQRSPNDPNYAYNLAVSLEHIEKPQSALQYYQRAMQNRGNNRTGFNAELVAQRIEVLTQ